MAQFQHITQLDRPRDAVFAWHECPGAIVRLTPPGTARVVSEPSDGLRDGSIAALRILVPLTAGRLGVGWTARHRGYRSGERFEDVMESGPLRSWHHVHDFADGDRPGTTVITDTVDYSPALPTMPARLAGLFGYRERQLRADLDLHLRHPQRRRFLVTGAAGLVGTQLVALLRSGGHEVWTLTRGPADPDRQRAHWDPDRDVIDTAAVDRAEVVIHLAGEPIGSRFTAAHKRRVLDSRTRGTGLVARTLAGLDGSRALISASASHYYGTDRGEELLTEDSAPGSGPLADVVAAWEQACDPAREAGLRVVNVRTGIVQSPAGGQLALQLPLYELGLGGRLGTGREWMSWIGIDDLVHLYAHLALGGYEGPVNAVAPHPVTTAEYARTLGRAVHRPAVIPVPPFGPALLLGRKGARELTTASQRMSAGAAQADGFEFRYPDLDAALHHVLAR